MWDNSVSSQVWLRTKASEWMATITSLFDAWIARSNAFRWVGSLLNFPISAELSWVSGFQVVRKEFNDDLRKLWLFYNPGKNCLNSPTFQN